MGGSGSTPDYSAYAAEFYSTALTSSCLLPDVGIDDSLLRFSGTNSDVALQDYSSQLMGDVGTKLPVYIQSLGSAFGALTPIPNAVGLGALVISMVMELCMLTTQSSSSQESYHLLRRVFAEEKASDIRDTMSEYLKRHRMYIRDDQRLVEEIDRLEKQLSNQLTRLKNSMLHDRQMSSRGLKHWVNGAAFHVQMLIHGARLKATRGESDYDAVNSLISHYLQDLRELLPQYKTYKISRTSIRSIRGCWWQHCTAAPYCPIVDNEVSCSEIHHVGKHSHICISMTEKYINHIFSNYEPITGLEQYFTNITSNLNYLINQHEVFSLPS